MPSFNNLLTIAFFINDRRLSSIYSDICTGNKIQFPFEKSNTIVSKQEQYRNSDQA